MTYGIVNEFDEVGLIAGGTGMYVFFRILGLRLISVVSTPMYQVLQHALADKDNKTKFKLLFANTSEPDILLREQLDALKSKHPNRFDVVYVIDKPSEKWTGTVFGRVFTLLTPRCRTHGVH